MHGVAATIERAISNLLDNAAKWSPPGAEVEVEVRDGQVAVRDHGPGIADEDLPYVFDRFYRARSARGLPGSGLGLAIVRQVAEAHGGEVVAERANGGGTRIVLRLGASRRVSARRLRDFLPRSHGSFSGRWLARPWCSISGTCSRSSAAGAEGRS